MELEFFCKPGEDLEWFDYWRAFCRDWLLSLGMKEEHLRLRDHEPEKLAFYSKATTDFEYLFPFGWGELWGVADRTDYDLTQHQNHSGKSMEYLDPSPTRKYIPYCIEPSLGVDRCVLAFLCNAYEEQELEGGDVRTVLHLHPALAPYKAAVLPLQKNKLGGWPARIYEKLAQDFMVDYDETGSIGKRYRRQDEIGTPFCICVDFDTEDRHRYHPRPRHHAAGAREGGRSGSLHCPAGEILNRVPFFGRGQVSDWLSPPIFENRTNGFRRENAAGLSNLRGTAL